MCGLCGYYTSEPTNNHLLILKGLLISNMGRGDDSTGVALINKSKVELVKRAVSADKFTHLLKYAPPIAIGHTRLATTGAITAKNAHPFTCGTITGGHNGIVSNYLAIDNQVSVDSEVIFKLIDQVGYSKAFKRLTGSFAIVWHDTKHPNQINLVRSGNPLHLAKVAGVGYVWSSEKHDLISHLVGYKYKLIPVPEDIVLTIDNDQINKTAVKFKHEYQYTWESDKLANYRDSWEDAEYLTPSIAPSKMTDPKYKGYQTQDIAWDIATNEGCKVCGAICDQRAWADLDGYIYCQFCKTYANQPRKIL